MNMIRRRAISVLMICLMMTGVFAIFGSGQAHAAEKYALPEKVVTYYFYEGEWDKADTTRYTYDKKANILKKKSTYGTEKYKNTYKKGKLAKVKLGSRVRTYNSKGRCRKETAGKMVTKFSTNGKGYITKATGTYKYTSTVKYHSNGMPSKITVKYNKNHIDKAIADFNEDGTISYIKEQYGKQYNEYKYTYEETENGLTVIGQSRENGKGEYEDSSKYVYSFGSKKTSDKRKYVSMMGASINYALMSSVMPEHFFVLGNG